MKKILLFLLLFFSSISIVFATELPINVKADSIILIDLDHDEVIYEKNADKREIMASLTKIMTAYTVIQRVDNLNKKVTITEKDLAHLEGFTCAGLKVGDKVSYLDLLYGLMLISGADAAQALANHTAGDMKSFKVMMNEEARNIIMRNSNFEDAYGGHDDNYSTARDMGKLLKEALKDPTFKKVFGTLEYTMSNGLYVVNYTYSLEIYHGLDTNLLTGNKSGYTPEAGLLLASTANVNGVNYALVVCKADVNQAYSNHVLVSHQIYNYVSKYNYENRLLMKKGTLLKKINVTSGTISEYPVYLNKDLTKILNDEEYENVSIKVNITDSIDSTYVKGDNLGYVDVFTGNNLIASYNVYLEDEIFPSTIYKYSYTKILPFIFLMIIGFVVFCFLLFNLLTRKRDGFIIEKKKKKKRNKKDELEY